MKAAMVRVLILALSVAALGAAVLLIPDVHALADDGIHGDTAAVRRDLDALGGWAALVLLLAVVIHNVVPIPAELLNGAAGYAFGVAVGIPLCLFCWLISGLVGYLLGVEVGRPLAVRLVGAHRLERLEDTVARGGRRALLIGRLLPFVPFTAISVVSGMSRVALGRFSWTTVVGTAPLVTVCVVLGARLQTPHFDDPVLLGALVGLIAVVVLAPMVGRRLTPPAARES